MSIVVTPRPGESQSQFLARFKGKVKNEGLIEEVRELKEYKKPSQIKQEELREKKRKIRKYKRERDKV